MNINEGDLITIKVDLDTGLLHEALDEGYSINCVYMDYAKAFDTVPHRRLLHKLSKYEINPKAVSWIENFLGNQTQQVIVQGKNHHGSQ